MHCVLFRLATGQLFEVISSRDHFDELEAASCVDQLLDVIQYLHNCRIAHLDIKVGGSTAWAEIKRKIGVADLINILKIIVCILSVIFSSPKLLRK